MITKEKVQDQLLHLGDEFSIDELIERLLLIEKIDRGLEQSKNNDVISDTELEKRTKEW